MKWKMLIGLHETNFLQASLKILANRTELLAMYFLKSNVFVVVFYFNKQIV